MNAAITTALRKYGYADAADVVARAPDPRREVIALQFALATLGGAQHVLRTHARALRNTSAAYERGRLRGLEEQIAERIGELMLKGKAS